MGYFSDQEKGPTPRTVEEITPAAWKGIWGMISKRLENGSFGNEFPLACPDGNGTIGHDGGLLEAAAHGDNIVWPVKVDEAPGTLEVLDLVQFCHLHVAQPANGTWHSFYGHHHLDCDVKVGRDHFLADIEKIFARNGIGFELLEDSDIQRIGPAVAEEAIAATVFKTGDVDLDALLETARTRFFSPSFAVRKESLEKLWDAFERLKTLEKGKDKKAAADLLLTKAAAGNRSVKETLDADFMELTHIGNTFMIRHTEVGKIPITREIDIDYFFHRAFAAIRHVLKATNRGG